MKISTRFTVISAVLILLLGLIANFPARLAYSWFAQDYFAVSGISGSIWSGSAQQANINGIYLSDTEWQLSVLRLFTGKLAASVNTAPPAGELSANILVQSDGSLHISNLEGQVPISILAGIVPLVGVSGTIVPRLAEIDIKEGRLINVVGSITIANLISQSVVPDVLGTFLVELQSTDSGIVGSVEDVEALIDIAGAITLSHQGAYSFIGQIAEKNTTPARLRQELTGLGPVNARGQRDFRLEGSL